MALTLMVKMPGARSWAPAISGILKADPAQTDLEASTFATRDEAADRARALHASALFVHAEFRIDGKEDGEA